MPMNSEVPSDSSSWNSDGLFKDLLPSECMKFCTNTNDSFEFGIPSLDLEISRSQNDRIRNKDISSSCSPSSSNSECSEELSLDYTCKPNEAAYLTDHDYLSTSLNLFDDNSMKYCAEEFEWSNFTSGIDNLLPPDSIFSDSYGGYEEMEVSPIQSVFSKPKRTVDPVADTSLWSEMASSEQQAVINSLTSVISTQMGLREQLEIIRIIEPSASVSATDTEFIINTSILNDQKLCRIRDYVKKVRENNRHQNQGSNKHNSHRRHESSRKSGCQSDSQSTAKSEGTRRRNSKVQKEVKERRPTQKVKKQRQKKEHRQFLKERRSGLFVREEVLSLSTQMMIIDEDSDIDILG